MLPPILIRGIATARLTTACLLLLVATTNVQSNNSIRGEVTDQNGAVVPADEVSVRGKAISTDLERTTDSGARYLIAALPTGEPGSSRQIWFDLRLIVQAL
jgi:hypothetical protein